MTKLFDELKRRKVFRIAGVYAVVSWVLAQVAAFAVDTFAAPQWVQQMFVVFLVLGFPVALVLAWAYEMTPAGVRADTAVHIPQYVNQGTDRKLNYAILVLVLLAVGFQVADRFVFTPDANSVLSIGAGNTSLGAGSALSRRFLIDLGYTVPLAGPETNADIALSPDGTRLAYSVTQTGGFPQLYLQELNQVGSAVLLTDNGRGPFFSADSQWVGFNRDNLSRISVRGGTAQSLGISMRSAGGGFWSPDDTIFYTDSRSRSIYRVPAVGGSPEPLEITSDDVTDGLVVERNWPHLLPGGDALLFNSWPRSGARDGRIDLLIQSTGEVKTLIQNGYNARYVPTGHIVFMRSESLWAVPFNLERLETNGAEVPVIQGIQAEGGRGKAAYSFSNEGLLVYLQGRDTTSDTTQRRLVWVDREGNEEILPEERFFIDSDVAPDGQRLALSISDNGNQDIFIYDMERSTVGRLTFHEAADNVPLWSPDGERVVFSSSRDGGGVYSQAADGTGGVDILVSSPVARPNTFTPDGSQLVFEQGGDLYVLTLTGESPPRPLLESPFNETRASISPDGRWIAYISDRTGRPEIYVRPFPDVEGGQWQISSEGGVMPKWSSDGRNLFFKGARTRDVGLWVASVNTETAFQYETPVAFTSGNYLSGNFEISADGSRFLLVQSNISDSFPEGPELTQLVAVENWFEELRRLAPPDPQ